MTTVDATAGESGSRAVPNPDVEQSIEAEGPTGNPALLGLPTFLVGALALGLVLVGYLPTTSLGGVVPVVLAANSLGLIIAAVWAASLSQNAVAGIFGTFAGFWLSFALLLLGLDHNWFAVVSAPAAGTSAAAAAAAAGVAALGVEKLFLLTWLIIIVLFTLVTLRLPLAFTVLFVLVDVALLLLLLGFSGASTGEIKTGGYFVFAFTAVGAYLFADAMSSATGGGALPLGRPLLH
jgi:hypothetical protein